MAIILVNNAAQHTTSILILMFVFVFVLNVNCLALTYLPLFPCISRSFPSLNTVKVGVNVEYVTIVLIAICF